MVSNLLDHRVTSRPVDELLIGFEGEGEFARGFLVLSLCLSTFTFSLLLVEGSFQAVDLRGTFLVLRVVETFTNVGDLHVDLLETRSDSSLDGLGESTLDETGGERTKSVDTARYRGSSATCEA